MKPVRIIIWSLIFILLAILSYIAFYFYFPDSAYEHREAVEISSEFESENYPVGSKDETFSNLPILSTEERKNLPDFIKAMPVNPTEYDEDGNWLRDDIEVYIAHKYPFEPEKRAANIQLAKVLDRIATDAGQSGDSRQITLWKDELEANECFHKNALSEKNMSELRAVVLNSESRKRSYDAVIELRKDLNQRLTDSLMFLGAECDSLIVENEQILQSWKAE